MKLLEYVESEIKWEKTSREGEPEDVIDEAWCKGFRDAMNLVKDQIIKEMTKRKKCPECGDMFNPYEQGDEKDIRCIDCIDIENATDKEYVELLERRR